MPRVVMHWHGVHGRRPDALVVNRASAGTALMSSDPDPGTPEGDRFDILATLVQAYEAKHVIPQQS